MPQRSAEDVFPSGSPIIGGMSPDPVSKCGNFASRAGQASCRGPHGKAQAEWSRRRSVADIARESLVGTEPSWVQEGGRSVSGQLGQATWTFVVDVNSCGSEVNPAGLLQLATLLDRHRTPASWAFRAHEDQRALELLLGRIPGADLLLAGGDAPLPPRGTRAQFAQWLEDRMASFHRLAKHPSGIWGLPVENLAEYVDLLVKHKLRWVANQGRSGQRASGDLEPSHTRYGIWSARPGWKLPQARSWSAPLQRLASRHRLANRVKQRQATVAVIDLPAMVRRPANWAHLEELLRALARWRNRGRLRAESLAGMTLVLQPPPRRAMRSILRAA